MARYSDEEKARVREEIRNEINPERVSDEGFGMYEITGVDGERHQMSGFNLNPLIEIATLKRLDEEYGVSPSASRGMPSAATAEYDEKGATASRRSRSYDSEITLGQGYEWRFYDGKGGRCADLYNPDGKCLLEGDATTYDTWTRGHSDEAYRINAIIEEDAHAHGFSYNHHTGRVSEMTLQDRIDRMREQDDSYTSMSSMSSYVNGDVSLAGDYANAAGKSFAAEQLGHIGEKESVADTVGEHREKGEHIAEKIDASFGPTFA